MVLQIALDAPLRRLFEYRCPPGVRQLRPGMRMRVPFGRRRLVGILVGLKAEAEVPTHKLRTAIEVLDAEPVFETTLFELLLWAAEYYRHPVGEVLIGALPPALRQGEPLDEPTVRWRLTELGVQSWQSLPPRSRRLRALAAALLEGAGRDKLVAISASWRAGLREFDQRGWLLSETTVPDRGTPLGASAAPAPALNAAQQSAVAHIVEQTQRGGFRTFLLHGVTGSGKTEVYLQAIASVIAQGKQALVLVPEIALTPQLVTRFEARFGARLAVLHSSLSDAARLSAWRCARSGAASIVIGTRSAIFAPLKTPGLIVVDEEHDASYKQQDGFRYSARDLAIARAQRHGIPVVLGSATPSLESLARAKKQPDDWLVLPERAGTAQPPRVRLIDLRRQTLTDGIAATTVLAIKEHLDTHGQVLLYLNRRGFAPVLFCPQCGWSAVCTRCDARMTMHRSAQRLSCHHCGYEHRIPLICPACGASPKPVGQGTERIEAALAKLFPDVPVARIDRDNVRRKGELEATLKRIHCGEVRMLVGTQMLTKGHDFPAVTLAVVLNADQGLFSADFRASERLAQTIVQVAGRAGRAERLGEVLIQTEYPEHPLLQSLLAGGYTAFAEQALAERAAARLPPFARLALLRAEAPSMHRALLLLTRARQLAEAERTASVSVFGPVAAPMPKRSGRHRAQLLLHAPSHRPLQKLLTTLVLRLESTPEARQARWSIDVDPVELF